MPSRPRPLRLCALVLLASWALPLARPAAEAAPQLRPVPVQLPGTTPEPPLAGTPEPPLSGPQLPQLHAPTPLPPVLPPVLPGPVLGSPDPPDPPAPVVAIRVRVAAVSAPRQEIEYRICVHNTSPAAAHHVLVRNPLPPNAAFVRAVPEPSARGPELLWHLGTLPPGACRDICLVLAPTDDCDVKNCARVQFEHGQCVTTRIARSFPAPGPVLPGFPSPPVVPGQAKPPPEQKQLEKEPPTAKEPAAAPALKLTMTGPKRQYANLPAKYQITVSNPGKSAATNVQIANPIPAGMTLVSSSAGSRLHAGQVAWNLGALEAGASKTVQIVLRAKQAGEFCNKATAQADDNLKAEAEVCTRFEGVSALSMTVADSKDPAAVGEELSYVIVVKNQGTAPVTNLKLTPVIPLQMQLLKATGPSNPPPEDKLPKATAEGQSLPFAPLKALAPGAEARYEIFVRAVQAGDVRFRVELNADQLTGGAVRDEESTRVFMPESGRPEGEKLP